MTLEELDLIESVSSTSCLPARPAPPILRHYGREVHMTNQPLLVAGVDAHKDTHYAAVITVTSEHIGAAEFPATGGGYRALTGFITCHGVLLRTGVEGTNSYGAGLTRQTLTSPSPRPPTRSTAHC